MAAFLIAKSFVIYDIYTAYTSRIDSVSVPEEWLISIKCFLDSSKMTPLITQELWGDGTSRIPHFSREDIVALKDNCTYILNSGLKEQTILDRGYPDYYIDIFREFQLSLKKLIILCERAINEQLTMVFISN